MLKESIKIDRWERWKKRRKKKKKGEKRLGGRPSRKKSSRVRDGMEGKPRRVETRPKIFEQGRIKCPKSPRGANFHTYEEQFFTPLRGAVFHTTGANFHAIKKNKKKIKKNYFDCSKSIVIIGENLS